MTLRGEATDRLAAICKDLGATSYLTGAYAVEVYLETPIFEKAGIELKFQEFDCPEYSQLYPREGFIAELSVVDLLFNCGSESLDILMRGTGTPSGERSK